MSQSAVAEQLYTGTYEAYAASLSTIYKLGAAGLSGEGIIGARTLAFDDFATKVGEMLKTDEEHGENIDIERQKVFAYRDRHVRTADGTPMVDVVRAGFDASSRSRDSRISTTQAERDEGDVIVAEAVDELQVGQALFAISVEPKKELSGPYARFWHDRGYRKGIAYLQVYHRVSETELWTGTFSVRHSDITAFRRMFALRGKDIPAHIDPNQFIRHYHTVDIEQGQMAGQIALDMRRQYYRDQGVQDAAYSVEQALAQRENSQFLRSMFDTYYPMIGGALVTGRNTPELQQFARDALNQIPVEKLTPEARAHIIRIANSITFDESIARILDDIMPYATKEHLRTKLYGSPQTTSTNQHEPGVLPALQQEAIRYSQVDIPPPQMQQLALAGLSRGIAAGRAGGGCAGVNLAQTAIEGDEIELGLSPQDVFGGKSSSSNKREEDCEFVSESCPKCGDKKVKTICKNGKYIHVGKGCSS